MVFNYQDIASELLKNLKPRTREILERRFGLRQGEAETLQAIGDDFGITRERVRQIEAAGLGEVEDKTGEFGPVFDFFSNQLRVGGGLREEKKYLSSLAPHSGRQQAFFLLVLGKGFHREKEGQAFHDLWTLDPALLKRAAEVGSRLARALDKKGRPVSSRELEKEAGEDPYFLFGLLEVSKKIRQGPQGLWGLSGWAEISPRGTKDKVYIVLKEMGKPLHFRKIAEIVNGEEIFTSSKSIHAQTVHNELIKDSRFVLVGRGIYALREWGYRPGTVSEVIERLLREEGPLSKEELVREVLSRRLVKKNTVLLNLRDRENVSRDEEGRYFFKKS